MNDLSDAPRDAGDAGPHEVEGESGDGRTGQVEPHLAVSSHPETFYISPLP